MNTDNIFCMFLSSTKIDIQKVKNFDIVSNTISSVSNHLFYLITC